MLNVVINTVEHCKPKYQLSITSQVIRKEFIPASATKKNKKQWRQ
jgi:hypothetical protein